MREGWSLPNEFKQRKLGTPPGKEVGMVPLFQFFLCVGFIITEFSKLEVALDGKLIGFMHGDYKYQWDLGPNIMFNKKVQILEKLLERNTTKLPDGKFHPKDLVQEYKESKLAGYLRDCGQIRNEVAHSLWTAMREDTETFRVIYHGEHLDWSMSDMLDKLAMIQGTHLKLLKTYGL